MLEIFDFRPDKPHEDITWSRVGLTHISFDVKNPYKWHDFLTKNGVEVLGPVEEHMATGLLMLNNKRADSLNHRLH